MVNRKLGLAKGLGLGLFLELLTILTVVLYFKEPTLISFFRSKASFRSIFVQFSTILHIFDWPHFGQKVRIVRYGFQQGVLEPGSS